jgi:hypothetical protein
MGTKVLNNTLTLPEHQGECDASDIEFPEPFRELLNVPLC